jgi:hypothetical protein
LVDTFGYPDGPIVGAADSPWASNTGATPATVTNGQLRLSFANSEDIVAPIEFAPIQTNGPLPLLYCSFTVRFGALPTQTGNYFAHFTGNSLSTHRARVFASTSSAGPGMFRLGIGNSSSANASSGQIPIDLATNDTHFVVVSYALNTGLSTIWLDPSSQSSPSVTATDAVAVAEMANFSFRQATGIGAMAVDNLKVGTTFGAVATAAGMIHMDASPVRPLSGENFAVVLRMVGYTAMDEVDGFNFYVDYATNLFAFVPGSFGLGAPSGSNQQWLAKANQDAGFSLVPFNDGSTPGRIAVSMVDLGLGLPNGGTVADRGFLVSFTLQAIAPGTGTLTAAPFVGAAGPEVLYDPSLMPVGVPVFSDVTIRVTDPPLRLAIQRLPGGKVSVSWTPTMGVTLEHSTEITAGWMPVAGAVSPLEVDASGPRRFWRLRKP